MAHMLRGKTAIVGAGHCRFGALDGRSELELLGEAVHAALADAGISLQDVDGLFNASSGHWSSTMVVQEYLGLRPRFSCRNVIGGSSFESHVLTASMALEAGIIDTALICYAANPRTGNKGRLVSLSEMPTYEKGYRPRNPPNAYALAAARHMHQYGTTVDQLAEIAVAARAWAQKNPEACTYGEGELTVEEVNSARMVVDPFTSRHCCLVVDGGGAIVMVRADRAKDFPKKPVYHLGTAPATWHRQISEMPDLTVSAASESGPRAFAMAGVTPADIDLVMLYDAFTICTLLFLEDLGFCRKGEGGAFVSDGNIAPGGALAVNTNGGGLSCVHPGMYGIFLLIEAVRQIRGETGDRQLRKCDIAVAHGNGGTLSSQVTTVLGSAAAL